MGFFDKMKSLVGVGAPTLTLDVDPPELISGRPISGSILIAAQERVTPIKSITITLVRDRDVAQPDGSTRSERTELSETTMPLADYVMAAGAKRRFSFELASCDLEAAAGETYRLLGAADTPGLDPRTSITLARIEPIAVADRVAIDPLTPAGLLAIRSGFIPKLAEFVGGDDRTVLIPRFGEQAYAPGQTFEKRLIDGELLEALVGRVVFMTVAWGSSFGVLLRGEKGDFAVVQISRISIGMSYAPVADIRSISLATFVSPQEDGLSHATLMTDQEDDAERQGRLFDPLAYRRQVWDLRAQYPEAC